jgi:hypothetical protein
VADERYSYGWEKYYQATDTLARGRGNLRDRLRDAVIYYIIHVHAENLPRELWERHEILMEKLTRVAAQGDEGTITATVNALDEDEAAELASEIVSIFNGVATGSY